jgi:hypothetical protein
LEKKSVLIIAGQICRELAEMIRLQFGKFYVKLGSTTEARKLPAHPLHAPYYFRGKLNSFCLRIRAPAHLYPCMDHIKTHIF